MPVINDIKIYDSSGNPVQRPFKEDEIIMVVLEGDIGFNATFKIKDLMDDYLDMVETSVKGIYQGNYLVKTNDDKIGLKVTGNLIEEGGEDGAVPVTKLFSDIVIDTGTPEITNAFFVAKDKQEEEYETLVPVEYQPEDLEETAEYYPYSVGINKPLNKDDKVEVAVHGAPGLQAYFTITDVAANIPMEETSEAGLYKGEYVIQAGDNSEKSFVVCFLKDSAEHLNHKECLGYFSVDTTKANVTAYGHNITGIRPVITGERIEVFIDGEQSQKAYFQFILDYQLYPEDTISVGQNYIDMFEQETPGHYVGGYTILEGDTVNNGRIKMYLEDKAGNVTDILLPVWVNVTTIRPVISSFVVQTFKEGSTFVYPLPSGNIEVSGPLNVNKLVVAVAEGAYKQQATFSIDGLENARDIPMVEYDNGLYLGSYLIAEGDNTLESPVKCKFVDEAGIEAVREAEKKITVDTTVPVINEVILKKVPDQPNVRKVEIDVTF